MIKPMIRAEVAARRAEEAGRAAELAAVAAEAAAEEWHSLLATLLDSTALALYHRARWYWGRAALAPEGRRISDAMEARGRDAMIALLEGRVVEGRGILTEVVLSERALRLRRATPWVAPWMELYEVTA